VVASIVKTKPAVTIRAFLIELAIYTILVVGYFFAVLLFLSKWISQLEESHITIYAFVAIALIIVQGIVLETVTTWLMRRLRGGRSE
jgi:hypothetical protein